MFFSRQIWVTYAIALRQSNEPQVKSLSPQRGTQRTRVPWLSDVLLRHNIRPRQRTASLGVATWAEGAALAHDWSAVHSCLCEDQSRV